MAKKKTDPTAASSTTATANGDAKAENSTPPEHDIAAR